MLFLLMVFGRPKASLAAKSYVDRSLENYRKLDDLACVIDGRYNVDFYKDDKGVTGGPSPDNYAEVGISGSIAEDDDVRLDVINSELYSGVDMKCHVVGRFVNVGEEYYFSKDGKYNEFDFTCRGGILGENNFKFKLIESGDNTPAVKWLKEDNKLRVVSDFPVVGLSAIRGGDIETELATKRYVDEKIAGFCNK